MDEVLSLARSYGVSDGYINVAVLFFAAIGAVWSAINVALQGWRSVRRFRGLFRREPVPPSDFVVAVLGALSDPTAYPEEGLKVVKCESRGVEIKVENNAKNFHVAECNERLAHVKVDGIDHLDELTVRDRCYILDGFHEFLVRWRAMRLKNAVRRMHMNGMVRTSDLAEVQAVPNAVAHPASTHASMRSMR